MVLAKQRHDIIWNRFNFPISMEGCILYMPLWQEDMRTSVVSYDRNRITGTVTGATWGSQGRTFDGTDDLIDCGNAAALQISTGTNLAWLKTTTPGTGYRGVQVKNAAFALLVNGGVFFSYDYTASAGRSSLVNVDDGVWRLLGVTMDDGVSNGSGLWINGVQEVSVTLQASNQGNEVIIGASTPAGAEPINGTIGETWLYNRILTAGEMGRIYQATKGRYSG